jgi:hypothetical protein
MPSYNTNLKTWGSTGQEYPNNYDYVEGEQPVDAWDNYFNYNVVEDIDHLINVTNNELLARDGSVNLQADLADDQGNTIWDYSLGAVPVSSQEASTVTVTAGGGLKGGGSFSNQGGSTTLNIEPADFAGSGLNDDGADNLELTNDSLTVTAGDGLDGGGSVSLGGSTSLSVDVSDFAGSGLGDDGSNNLEITASTGMTNGERNIMFHGI